jgi:hypothetical protein
VIREAPTKREPVGRGYDGDLTWGDEGIDDPPKPG